MSTVKSLTANRRKKGYREAYEKYLGITISSDYDVHHIDLNPLNDDMSNLVALPSLIHQEYHSSLDSHNRESYYINQFRVNWDNKGEYNEMYPRLYPQIEIIKKTSVIIAKINTQILADKKLQELLHLKNTK